MQVDMNAAPANAARQESLRVDQDGPRQDVALVESVTCDATIVDRELH